MQESQVANRWRAQGERRARRDAVLALLRAKYPATLDDKVVQLVLQQGDVALLRRWFSAALNADTFEKFAAALKE